MRSLFTLLFIIIIIKGYCQMDTPDFRFHGLKISVKNLDDAVAYYTKKLGFKEKARNNGEVELYTGSWPIYLKSVPEMNTSDYPNEARTTLTVQTYKLLPRIDEFRSNGIMIVDSLLERNGVGISIPFKDPSGNILSLMEIQIRETSSFENISLYNTGVTITDMDAAIEFYETVLNFEEWSRDYLPAALPLKHADGTFAFMIHQRKGLLNSSIKYGTHSMMTLILTCEDIEKAGAYLKQNNVRFEYVDGILICQDPEGNYLEIRKSN